MTKIAILWWGTDDEKAVSKKSADFIELTLQEMSLQYDRYEMPEQLDAFLWKKDDYKIAVPIIHGGYGEDGVLCEILERHTVPHAYSLSEDHKQWFDKKAAKIIAQSSGINVSEWVVCIPSKLTNADIETALGKAPWFSKPNASWSSLWAKIIHSLNDIDEEFQNEEMIIETYLKGDEYSVWIVEWETWLITLPVMQVKLEDAEFFDYQVKYEDDGGLETFPENIEPQLEANLKKYALDCHKLFHCRTMSRTDFIVRDGAIYFLEINTIPGFSEVSIIPRAWRKMGRSNAELISCLLK